MSDAPKCEPPEELRGVDGLHWVAKRDKDGEPVWWISTGFWSFSGWSMTPKEAAKMGYRYLSPVLTPTEASALRAERDAAVAEVARLREALKYIRAYPNAIAAQTNADAALTPKDKS